MGIKSKRVLSLQEGNVVETVTKTRLLEGITVFAANITAGLVISSAVGMTSLGCPSIVIFLLVPTLSLTDYGKENHVPK